MRLWNELFIQVYDGKKEIEDIIACVGTRLFWRVDCPMRVMDVVGDLGCRLILAPVWRYHPTLVVYRLWCSLRLVKMCAFHILRVWRLMEFEDATIPTWQGIRPLKWLASLLLQKQGGINDTGQAV